MSPHTAQVVAWSFAWVLEAVLLCFGVYVAWRAAGAVAHKLLSLRNAPAVRQAYVKGANREKEKTL